MAHLVNHESDHEAAASDLTQFGFWVYLMTDLLMFTVLFAVYAVLYNNTAGGPTGRELFHLPAVLAETLILLTSSLTCGLGQLAARTGKIKQLFGWFGVTFGLGVVFLALELKEFTELIQAGNSPHSNAFLSAFFTLVGAHGLHIFAGLLWIAITFVYVMKRGLNASLVRKLALLSLYWHFLDLVWIFIFTLVYLRAFI